MCAGKPAPKSRRVASLPQPRAVGEQVHVEVIVDNAPGKRPRAVGEQVHVEVIVDHAPGKSHVVVHATDAVLLFQLVAVTEDKWPASLAACGCQASTSRPSAIQLCAAYNQNVNAESVSPQQCDWSSTEIDRQCALKLLAG